MKKLIAASALAAAAAITGTPALAANVGVSIGFSQPGVYGRVDVGRFPRPDVVVQQPVIVARPVAPVAPVYMWVPPEHRVNWRRYCGGYGACGAPVYFVRDDWYGRQVRPYGPGPGRYHDGWRDGRRDWHGDDRGPDRRDGRDRDHHH